MRRLIRRSPRRRRSLKNQRSARPSADNKGWALRAPYEGLWEFCCACGYPSPQPKPVPRRIFFAVSFKAPLQRRAPGIRYTINKWLGWMDSNHRCRSQSPMPWAAWLHPIIRNGHYNVKLYNSASAECHSSVVVPSKQSQKSPRRRKNGGMSDLSAPKAHNRS